MPRVFKLQLGHTFIQNEINLNACHRAVMSASSRGLVKASVRVMMLRQAVFSSACVGFLSTNLVDHGLGKAQMELADHCTRGWLSGWLPFSMDWAAVCAEAGH